MTMRSASRRHDDADAADLGELDGVAGEVDQHLAEAVAVADDPARHAGGHEGGDLDALALRFRGQELDDALDEGVQIERRGDDVDAPGLDLGEVEDLVDERQEGLAGGLDGVRVGGLLGAERGVEDEVRHAEDAVQRRAELVADRRQEARFRLAGRFRLAARLLEGPLRHDPVGDLAAEAQDRGGAAGAARRRLDPGDPADAVARRDRLVDEARAVGAGVDGPALDHLSARREPIRSWRGRPRSRP